MENWGIVLGIAVAAGVGAYFYGRKPTRTARLRQALAAVAAAEKDLGQNGRILVRKSGTEPLVRVMAEGDDSELVRSVVDQIIEAIPQQGA